jgi:hypothetical protein
MGISKQKAKHRSMTNECIQIEKHSFPLTADVMQLNKGSIIRDSIE